ncbi:MAG: carbohydrate kinase family protein [Candidatus Helarchaeota archaeon]
MISNNSIDLACIGSNNLDIIMMVEDVLRFELFDKDKIKKYTAIEYSSKLNVHDMVLAPGGSAANIAVDVTYLGMKSAYIGKLGNDSPGQSCILDLKEHDVDIKGVILTDKVPTGMSVILITPYGKDRSILAFKGANNYIRPEEVRLEVLDRSSALVWTSLTSDSGIEAIRKSIEHVKSENKTVFAAPSMSILAHQMEEARSLVKRSDVISLNREELKLLTGEEILHSGLEKVLKLGPGLVACTNGKKGSFLTNGKDLIEASTYEIDVKDTTGAGDAYMSGLIYGCLENMELEEMIKFASAFSAFECMALGVREGFPHDIKEVTKFIDEKPIKIRKSAF